LFANNTYTFVNNLSNKKIRQFLVELNNYFAEQNEVEKPITILKKIIYPL